MLQYAAQTQGVMPWIVVAPLQMSTVRTSCTQSTGQQVTINERRSLLTKPGRNEADGKIGARGLSD